MSCNGQHGRRKKDGKYVAKYEIEHTMVTMTWRRGGVAQYLNAYNI